MPTFQQLYAANPVTLTGQEYIAVQQPNGNYGAVNVNQLSGAQIQTQIFQSGSSFIPGTTTTLTLNNQPGSTAALNVYMDGIFQSSTIDWTLSGANITFISPIPMGVSVVSCQWSASAFNMLTGRPIQVQTFLSPSGYTLTLTSAPASQAALSIYMDLSLIHI